MNADKLKEVGILDMGHQGDVLIVRVDPTKVSVQNSKVIARDNGRVVLAYGEVTGHAHAIEDEGVALFEIDQNENEIKNVLSGLGIDTDGSTEVRWMVSEKGGLLTHEEHDPIVLTPESAYVVIRQREYNYMEQRNFMVGD